MAHYEYSAFGEPVVTSGELAASFTHQFSTKPYCAATGFSEYQMRKYRAEIGRWMSRDPRLTSIGLKKSEKQSKCWQDLPYLFAKNSPPNAVDVKGEIAHWAAECGVGCVYGAVGGFMGSLGDVLRGNWRGVTCSTAGGAVSGCCQSVVCSNIPQLCIQGSCVCAAIGNLIEQSCKGDLDISNPCSLFAFLMSTGMGCLTGIVAESKDYALEIVAFLTGLDVSAITSLCGIMD